MDSRADRLNIKGLKRSVFKLEIQWPEIEAEFNWCRENIQKKGEYYNQTGVVLSGAIELNPLIGLKATLDFLALAQRAHPAALALIAAADLTMALIGDGSKITCELSASGSFGGKIQGFLNTKTKENSFNKNDRQGNDKELAELKCDLEFKLKIAINIELEKKAFFIKVTLGAKAKGEATAKWTGRAPIDADDYGWYIAPELTFQGLEILLEVEVKAERGGRDDQWFSSSSISAKKELRWQVSDPWEKPKSWGKMHFIKKQ